MAASHQVVLHCVEAEDGGLARAALEPVLAAVHPQLAAGQGVAHSDGALAAGGEAGPGGEGAECRAVHTHPVPLTQCETLHSVSMISGMVTISAVKRSIGFTITEKAPSR